MFIHVPQVRCVVLRRVFFLGCSVRVAGEHALELDDVSGPVSPGAAHRLHPGLVPALRLLRQNALQTPL